MSCLPGSRGSLLRTGPAKFEVGSARAPLVRRARDAAPLHDRRRARLLRQPLPAEPSYRAAREQGRIVYGEFATDPCRSLFGACRRCSRGGVSRQRQRQRHPARRAVHRDDRDAAADPVRPARRSGRRRAPYKAPGQLTTAHPHSDRASGEMLNYAAKLGPRSSYRFFASAPTRASPA